MNLVAVIRDAVTEASRISATGIKADEGKDAASEFTELKARNVALTCRRAPVVCSVISANNSRISKPQRIAPRAPASPTVQQTLRR
jgi:hypothetical protein